jgi:hypothetical protein
MANYAYVEDNNVSVYDQLPKNWKNISNFFACDDWVYLNSLGWYEITKIIPDYNPETQKLDNPTWTFTGSTVTEEYDVIDLPVEPEPEVVPVEEVESLTLQQLREDQWARVRNERDRLMADFEWRYSRRERYIRLGLPILDTLDDMDRYMQALADITLQENPAMIEWPTYVSSTPPQQP